MGEDPREIREQIVATRERMGDTADALAYKADVPSRAKEAIGQKTDAIRSKIGGAAQRANEATPDAGQVAQGARRAAGVAQENPLGLAVGALAVGFLAGMLIPGSRMEDERIGPVADRVKDTAREVGQEALDRGREVGRTALEHGKEAAQDVAQTVREEGQAHGRDLAQSAKEHAGEAAQAARGGEPG